MLISASDIVRHSVDTYKKNVYLFLNYILILFVPIGLTQIFDNIAASTALGKNEIFVTCLFFLNLLAIFAGIWINIAFVKIYAKVINNQKMEHPKKELQNVGHIVLPAIIVSFLYALITLGGLVLLIVPGVIFMIWYFFAQYFVVIDEKKPMEALRESKKSVKGRWWEVLWRLSLPTFVFGLISAISALLVGGIFSLILQTMPEQSSITIFVATIFSLIVGIIGLLFLPLTTGATVILFFELKKTREVKSS